MDEEAPGFIRNPHAQLSKAQLEGLRRQLLSKRAELETAIRELNQLITRKQDCSVAVDLRTGNGSPVAVWINSGC